MTPEVASLRFISDITGKDYTGKWDVYGTDLGIPVYSPAYKRMYFLFGDTFGIGEIEAGKPRYWRSTIAGYTSDFDFTKGVNWEGFFEDKDGKARELVAAHHTKSIDRLEVTKICQGGIEVDGKLYLFYESINNWGPTASGIWHLNFGGVIRSDDGGKTCVRIPDLTWIEPTDPEDVMIASRLVREDESMHKIDIEFDANAHVAPGYGQMYACDGKDGYIYLFGRPGGRIRGIKVARVRRENIETFAAYDYLVRYENGQPVWKNYREGLDEIIANPEAAEVIPAPTSNMSVSYNGYLGCWLLTYYYPSKGIYFATSKTPYGPFSEPQVVIPFDHPELTRGNQGAKDGNALYGGFTSEMMNRENGKITPIILSQWYNREGQHRYYGSRMFEIEWR